MSEKQPVSRLRTDIAVGGHIARAELRDLLRRKDSRRQRLTLTLLVVLAFPLYLAVLRFSYLAGVESRTGVELAVVAMARNLLTPTLLVVVLFGALGAAQTLSRDSVRTLLLTSVSARAIVVGNVLYLLGTWLALASLGLVPVIAYAAGARTPFFVLAVVGGILPLLVVAMLVGLSLAYLLWVAIVRLGLSERARRLVTASISVVAFLAAFGAGITLGRTTADPTGGLPTEDPTTPLGWYADVLFVGSPMAEPLGIRTVGAALAVLLSIPLAFSILVGLAPRFWYATADRTEGVKTPVQRPVVDRPPSVLVGRHHPLLGHSPVLRTAFGYARQALRRPDQFVYLLYYLFPVAAVLVPVGIDTPSAAPLALGLAAIVIGVWFAGSVFCLNPLGSEGAMLSQVVLARRSPSVFVHGRLLAGIGLGWVLSFVGILLVVGSLWSFNGGPPPALPIAVGTVGVFGAVVVSACVAMGVGSVLPKSESVEVFDSVEAVIPSILAALIHGVGALLVLTWAGVLALAVTPQSPLDGIQILALAGGVGAICWGLADGSRRFALARLRDYGRERTRVDRPFVAYAAVGLALLSILLGQSAGLTAMLLLGFDRPIEQLLPVLFVVEYLGSVVVALGFLYVTRRGLAYLDVSWPSLRNIAAIVAGLVGMLALWAVASVGIAQLGLPAADHALFDTDDIDGDLLLLLIPLVLLVNGPVEELLYRNIIQKYLAEQFTTVTAIGLTSGIFALVHVPVYLTAGVEALGVMLVVLFGLSAFLGILYARTRSLVVVAAVHGGYNALLILGLYVTTVA